LNAPISSHLQYRIIDWGGAYEIVGQQVQVLQKRILKRMTFTCRWSCSNSIFKIFKIFKEI